MSIATTEEQRAAADAVRGWAARTDPRASSRRQHDAADAGRAHWADLVRLGVFAVALPESLGGAGGTVADLAVMLEQCATELTPGPVLSTALAGLLLADTTDSAEMVKAVEQELPIAVALSAATLTATRSPDRSLVVTGTVRRVLGADITTMLLLAARVDGTDAWFLLDPTTSSVTIATLDAQDFSRTVADVTLDAVHVPVESVVSNLSTARVRELAVVLGVAEASGIARWCLRTAVDYAKVREQFGKPIGSFQSIKHLCAEMLCRAELATATAWDAAQCADDDGQRPIAAAVAASIALDAAVENAKDCIQVLGGIGFTWEHDAHLYLRRALALRQWLGGSSTWRKRAAQLTLAGDRRTLTLDLDDAGVDRDAVRSTAERVATLPESQRRSALVEAGWLAAHWPAPYGLSANPVEQLVIDQELARAGVSRPDLVIAGWAVPTILKYGTPAQVQRFVEPTLRGQIVWCQLFSEPGAGSDLASLRTRAQKVDGGWRLSGQKVWTSMAQRADWAICLARTDADAPKHKGISYFLVDMHTAGLDIRPLREITGEALFNEVFLDDVFVPDEMVVGEINEGWKLARTTLVNERLAMGGGSSIGDAVENLVALAQERGFTHDDCVLEDLGRHISDGLAGSVLELRSTLGQLTGQDTSAQSSVRKLVGVRHRQAVAEAALDLLGPDALADSAQLHQFLMTRCLTIAGGTTQVLLTVAGERILGLPRG
ncbi:MAG: acyl-CoA dehydrogenase [Jatrophihabitantaceae bacterium]